MKGYRIFNNQLFIYPIASSNHMNGIKLFYYQQRELPTEDNEETDIQDDALLVDWALYQVLMADGDLIKAEIYRRSFEQRKANIRGNQPTPFIVAKNYWG